MIILFWAGYTALAQPGVPPCWLEKQPCQVHIHFSKAQESHPHTHEYLFDLTRATGAQALATVLLPAGLLIELLMASFIFRKLHRPLLVKHSWAALPVPPPPRDCLSS
jgi:hypothetical protein